MKKIIARPLCIILMLAMLVPMMSVMAGAAEVTNLYVAADATIGTPAKTKDDAASGNRLYVTSAAIPVKAGDVVTFGPVLPGQGYYITTYDADGNQKIAKIAYADCTSVAVVTPSAEIVKWTVTEGSAYVRVVNSQMFKDNTMITVNREFTAAEYFAEMDKKGINVDCVRPTTAKEPLVNLFPTSDATFLGRSDSSKIEVASDSYRTSAYIPVKGGDVLYFGAAVKSQGYQLTLFGADKKPLTNVKIAYMVEYADLGDGLAIYAYSMPHDAEYVRVVAATSVYDAGKQLATINQPFNAEGYNNFFNPPETTEPAPETTVPAPETTEPPVSSDTGDTAIIFAAIAMISLAGVAVVAKRREN